MLLLSVRDLQWRRRRFTIAVLATALIFGMSMLMAGTERAFYNDGRRIVGAMDADTWLVAAGTAGPFTTSRPIAGAAAAEVRASAGVRAADPVVILHSTLDGAELRDINVIGHPPGSFAAASVTSGRGIAAAGETVVDTALGLGVGERVMVGGIELEVVGTADDVTWYFGTPTLFVALEDAQQVAFDGQPLANTIVVDGQPPSLAGLSAFTPEQVIVDMQRPLASSSETVALLNSLLWLVAAGIVGSMIYLSALERSRDFAVLKATGATTRLLLGGLLVQSAILVLAAGVLAVVFAQLLVPAFPFRVELTADIHLRLAAVGAVVGCVATLAGLRRAVKVPPALAFGGN